MMSEENLKAKIKVLGERAHALHLERETLERILNG